MGTGSTHSSVKGGFRTRISYWLSSPALRRRCLHIFTQAHGGITPSAMINLQTAYLDAVALCGRQVRALGPIVAPGSREATHVITGDSTVRLARRCCQA